LLTFSLSTPSTISRFGTAAEKKRKRHGLAGILAIQKIDDVEKNTMKELY